jgi:hypothetical protein
VVAKAFRAFGDVDRSIGTAVHSYSHKDWVLGKRCGALVRLGGLGGLGSLLRRASLPRLSWAASEEAYHIAGMAAERSQMMRRLM